MIFKKTKGALEKVKDKAIEEIVEVSKGAVDFIGDHTGKAFDLLDAKGKLEKKLTEKEAIIDEKNEQLEIQKNINTELLNLLEEVTKQLSSENKELKKKVKELGTDKYRVVKVKPCTGERQITKLKSSAKNSAIAKEMREK